jgi:Rod binding domain-containing protein
MKIDSDLSVPTVSDVQRQKQAKLVDAAQQFEATMLQELLKPMQHGQSSWGDEEKNDDSATDTMSTFGTESIAKAISKRGGFGIARSVVKQVTQEHQRQSERSPPVLKFAD